HIPISFAPEDRERMTNDFMTKLAEEYMQNMGIKDTQYIIVRHHDADNEHVHIIYNRIDNNGKLITDKNDYKRNVATCKKIKDKYNLTYGVDKSRVKRHKLKGSEKTKYEIHDAIMASLPYTKTIDELGQKLSKEGVNMELKYRRGTNDVQGISFAKDDHRFKGSQIDRSFSYGYLVQVIKGVAEVMSQREAAERKAAEAKHTITMSGKMLTPDQKRRFLNGEKVWIEGMTNKSGELFNSFVKLSEDRKTVRYSKQNIPFKLGNINLSESQRATLDDGKTLLIPDVVLKDGERLDLYTRWSKEQKEILCYRVDPDTLQKETPQSQTQLHQPSPPQHEQSHDNQQSGSVISGGLGIFDLPTDSGEDDPEETQFRNRMQQQQKKKRGRRM
ncbi:MAG: relaxase/mobilization nuclease domain-containing protein, partial [Rikenellaceae bacterium]